MQDHIKTASTQPAVERSDRPQVSSVESPPPSKRRVWPWLLFFALLGAGSYVTYTRYRGTTNATKAGGTAKGAGRGPSIIPVTAAKARKGSISVYLNGLGAVTPIYTVTVKSRVDGQLMKVLYKEGDPVHEGDLLAIVDPRPFEVQLEQAEAQLARDQATLENSRVDLKRYQTLLPMNAIPEQQVATQKAVVAQNEASIKTDQAQIDAVKLNLTYTRILAPITGRVGLRLVDPGNMVHASDANGLLVITQLQPISVIFTIPEDQVPAVVKKQRGARGLKVDAYDREMKNRIASGTLTTLDNQIDPSTGTLKLRATFDNADSTMFPNQFVNARLLLEQKYGVTIAPAAAVQRNAQRTYAFVVADGSKVQIRDVTTGASEGEDTEILSGLTPGEVVVVSGVDKLQEGTKVNAQFERNAGARKAD